MADGRDGAGLAGEGVDQRGGSGARRERLLDAERRPVARAISAPVWRARTSGLVSTSRGGAGSAASLSPSARACSSPGCQLAQLVRLAGRGLGMPAEVDAHEQQDRDNAPFIRA